MESSITVDKVLTDRQKRLIPYLAAAKSIEAGCREAGISDVTFYAWSKNPAFKEALQEARDSLVRESMDNLKSHIGMAVQVLADLLSAKSPETRRKASVDLINFYLKWREGSELQERLVSLERLIVERKIFR